MKWIFILKMLGLFFICSGMNYAKACSVEQNICANNKTEVLSSEAFTCKLNQMNGDADSLFRTFRDQNTAMMNQMIQAQITIKEDGQYEVTSNLFNTSGSGQICLENGELILRAGEMHVAISSLDKIDHSLPLGTVDQNGVEQVLALELVPTEK